jgi:glycosyltransferase involved in cell wall biosynthesis
MKILILYDSSAPKYFRLLLPCFYMPGVELISTHTITDEQLEGVDIVYFNRLITNQSVYSMMDLRKKHGFKLVVDFDDHWVLDKDHYLYESYQQRNISELMVAFIEEADAVTVTHERLANQVKPINPNVHVLPNAIPKQAQFLCRKQHSDTTRLFWAGGITHEKDIQLLFEPVKQLRDLPVQMVMGGYSKRKEYYSMRNAFTRYGRMNHELIEALPVADYYYAYSKCDIALIPLCDTRFNSFKSNLKILEAANIGANVIVSNVHPYKDCPYVNYVDEPQDWHKWVKWLLSNPDDAKEQALQLQKYCDEHYNFETINQKRKQLFEQLCNQQTANTLKTTEGSTPHG